jgi:hypothetical protein
LEDFRIEWVKALVDKYNAQNENEELDASKIKALIEEEI